MLGIPIARQDAPPLTAILAHSIAAKAAQNSLALIEAFVAKRSFVARTKGPPIKTGI